MVEGFDILYMMKTPFFMGNAAAVPTEAAQCDINEEDQANMTEKNLEPGFPGMVRLPDCRKVLKQPETKPVAAEGDAAKLRREQRGLRLHYRRVRIRNNRRVNALRRNWSKRRSFARKMTRVASRARGAYTGAVRARRRSNASAKKHMKRRFNRKENELDMIMKIECMVWKLNGHKKNHRVCRRKLASRMRSAARRGIGNKLRGIWSGGCTRHSHRNRGWPQYCLNGQDFPQKGKKHFRVYSNGRIVARSAGTYRFRAAILQYTSGWGRHRLQLRVNGRQRGDFYSNYNHNWNTGTIDTMLNLRRGDVVTLRAHTAGGGNVYAWHSWNRGSTHSRMQIMYYGNKTYHSAGCSRSPGRGWGYYCTNRTFKSSPYVRRQGGYKLRIQKSGLYRVNAVAAQYTRGRSQQDSEIYRNNKRISYSHNYKNRWYANSNDVNWYFRKGDTVKVRFYTSNGHRYHSGNRAGVHSRLQLSYEGNSRHPSLSAYCTSSPRRSWRNYCLNRVEVNKMRKFARIQGHKIRVLKSGWYRYNHWAITHTRGYTSQHSRTYINGRVKYYSHDTQASWNRHATDFVWYFKKGDTVWTQHYSPNSYSFHSGNPTGAHSRTQFTLEGF